MDALASLAAYGSPSSSEDDEKSDTCSVKGQDSVEVSKEGDAATNISDPVADGPGNPETKPPTPPPTPPPKKKSLKLPPPDFMSSTTSVTHQFAEHCGCKHCDEVRWRRVHKNQDAEEEAERKEREREEAKKQPKWRRKSGNNKGGGGAGEGSAPRVTVVQSSVISSSFSGSSSKSAAGDNGLGEERRRNKGLSSAYDSVFRCSDAAEETVVASKDEHVGKKRRR